MEKIKKLKKTLEEAGDCCSLINICVGDLETNMPWLLPRFAGFLLDERLLEFRPMQAQIIKGLGFYIYEIQGKAGTGLDHAKISKHADVDYIATFLDDAKISKHADADYIATFLCEHEISLPEDGIHDIVDYIFYEGKVI